MNKKISIGLALSLIIIAATASFAVTMTFSKQMYDKVITDLPAKVQKYDLFADIDEVISDHYYYYKKINNETLNNALAGGYVKGLDDNACVFMTAAEYEKYAKRLEGSITGIGIEHAFNKETGKMYVTEVAENSPAEQEGLKKGDVIVKIKGIVVTAGNYENLAGNLEGNRLKTVDITYSRGGYDTNINVMIGYTSQSVFYKTDYWVQNVENGEGSHKYGYVRITAFYKNTVDQFEKAVKALESQDIEKIIFDVRGTHEGSLEYAAEIIDKIVPATEGTTAIATVRDKSNAVIDTKPSDSEAINLPMAVLINAETSGVAELFAQDVKDFQKDNAVLVGVRTAGNNSLQEVFELKNGNAVMLPVGIITPYSTSTYGKTDTNQNGKIDKEDLGGVVPDFEKKLIPGNSQTLEQLDSKNDTQLQTALSELWKG